MPHNDRPRGRAALDALEASGKLFATPQEVAAVMGRDFKTIYPAMERGEIPFTRIGQRYQISMAWLRRQVDGVPDRTAAGAA
jgi:excisionase family DNA binding protein